MGNDSSHKGQSNDLESWLTLKRGVTIRILRWSHTLNLTALTWCTQISPWRGHATLFLTSACEPLRDQIRRYSHDAAWTGDSNLNYWNAPVTRNNMKIYHYCFCHFLFNVAWSISLDEHHWRGPQNVTVASVLWDGTTCTVKPDQTLQLYFYHIWRSETTDQMWYSFTAVQIRQRFFRSRRYPNGICNTG